MSEQPPSFTYQPLAYAPQLGIFEDSELECACCGRARGWIYSGSIYSIHDVVRVCPWCIADGSAHRRWDASFCQDIEDSSYQPNALQVVLAEEVVDQVLHRTPGYTSWQGAIWKTHCDDVCEFHGDISTDDLCALPPEAEQLFRRENSWALPEQMTLQAFTQKRYTPKGDMSIYKFICRHCGIVRLHVDLS